ncbi:N-acetylglucosaminyldiphosphoundecaprenol N-acetyl-beta-D-mannosaminyltransferase [Lachnospiraceae bacterium]|uniref:WecB/TagA/CpsF family glycosyltransferase n=1 Tax=Candidatus Merdisoma sp. JLR.KK011 TaxID=3114299 RepID=UPI00143356F6|nr:N-acetylglucosaminyldiphosphoundecaprenol N-acetyl-beta-D-mannosaminyltransferase [Lachnospiraceae bacterium]
MAENEREKIPKYRILGVDIAATNMEQVLRLLAKEGRKLSGEYICVSNVHTTVMSYDNPQYCAIQNNAFLALPDGKPLSILCRKKGFCEAGRVTGPDLMLELLKMSAAEGYRHYFYGGSQETLDKMQKRLQAEFPQAIIAGMYSPPFRQLTREENRRITEEINCAKPDFVWVGLGAPKQEIWMAEHKGKTAGLMIGVGAAFDYFAGNIKRAPAWMQKCCLEWLYRLLQEPGRLWKRYFVTNLKFLWLVSRGKHPQ